MPRAAPTAADEPAPPGLPGGCDISLVNAARSGDRAAFTCLYRRYAPMVHAVLLSRVPALDAEDLVQEVFMLALRQMDSLRDPAAAGPWLAAIARNSAASLLRSRRCTATLDREVVSDGPAPPGPAEAQEALDAIRSLPETYRETLMMRLVEGLTGPQIAARTGMTQGSVRVNLHRGMSMLRERLGVAGPAAGQQQGDRP